MCIRDRALRARAMAAIIIASVACRIRDLRGGMRSGLSLDAAIKLSQETKTTILKVVCTYPPEISLDTASALIACISEGLELFSPECRQTLIDSIISACVVGKFLSPRLLMRAWGERVSATSGTGRTFVTGTAATDRAGDAMLREQGTWDYGPV